VKIVYVSDSIYPYNKGGKEKRLYEISTRLASMGHEVHIYTMHWWKSTETSRLEDGVHLHAISKYYPLYKDGGDRRSIKEGVLFGLACLRLFRVKFDVLDVDHMPFFPIYAAWFVCILRGRRRQFYGTWHEALNRKDWIRYMGIAGNIASVIERVSIHLPYMVTAASPHTQRLIKSELNRKKRVALVTSGIDLDMISHIKPARVRCDVLYAGRLVKDKNVDVLVEAIALIAASYPKIRCTIIGHGIEKDNIAEKIKQLGMIKNISLLAPLTESRDVYAYMQAAKVFCLPSVREGFGIVALEALACGTPVVTTNAAANAAKDLITDGGNGSVVALGPITFAVSLQEWVMSPRKKHIRGKAEGYGWGALASTQAEVYAL
jgi:glycosyltransferase involved in cell wall biosynthesis